LIAEPSTPAAVGATDAGAPASNQTGLGSQAPAPRPLPIPGTPQPGHVPAKSKDKSQLDKLKKEAQSLSKYKLRQEIKKARTEKNTLSKRIDIGSPNDDLTALSKQWQQAQERMEVMSAELDSRPKSARFARIARQSPMGDDDFITDALEYLGEGRFSVAEPSMINTLSRELRPLFKKGPYSDEIYKNWPDESLAEEMSTMTSSEQMQTVIDKLETALAARKAQAQDLKKWEYEGGVHAALMENLGRSVGQRTAIEQPVGGLKIGEVFKIKNEKFEVKDILDDGERIIEDGMKLTVDPGVGVYVDRGVVMAAPYQKVDLDVDFFHDQTPEQYLAEAVAKGRGVTKKFLDEYGLEVPEGYKLAKEDVIPANAGPKLTKAQAAEEKQVLKEGAEAEPLNMETLTPEQQAAEAARLKAQADARKQQEEIAERQERRLAGDSSDVGQGRLFQEDEDLFSGASAERGGARGGDEYELFGSPAPAFNDGTKPDWVLRPAATARGRKLIEGLKRDRQGKNFTLRSITDFINDLIGVEMRRSASQTSKRHPAHYRPHAHVSYTRHGMSQINYHEAGHGLKELIEGRVPKVFDGPMKQGLIAITKMEGSMASANNVHEGVAEWVRRRVVNPETIEGLPVTQQMNRLLDEHFPEIGAGLDDAARAWYAFQQKPAMEKWKAINRDARQSNPLELANVLDLLGRGFSSTVYKYVASGAPLSRLERGLFRAIKKNHEAMEMSRKQAVEVARKHRSRTDRIMYAHNMLLSIPSEVQNAMASKGAARGIRAIDFSKAGKDDYRYYTRQTWNEIMNMMPLNRWNDFQHGGWAKHTLTRYALKGHDYPGKNEGMTVQALKDVVAEAERLIPNFNKAFDAVQDYFDALLEMKFHGGLKSADEMKKMKQAFGGEYWPLPRQLWGQSATKGSGARSGADIDAGDRRAFGSQEAIQDLTLTAEGRTRDAMTSYYSNAIRNLMVDTMNTFARSTNLPPVVRNMAARVMQPLKLPVKVAATLGPEEVKAIFRKHWDELVGQLPRDMDIVDVDDLNLSFDFKDIYRPTRPHDYNVISVLRGG
jgi:hypothetical protein